MVTNQGWNDEHIHPKKRGMHTIHDVDILSAKMDLLMKKIDKGSNLEKDQEANQHNATAHAIEANPWCEVCGGDDHSGNNCPKTREDMNFIIINNNNNNNGYRSQQQNGWN